MSDLFPTTNCPEYWTTPEEIRRFREEHPGFAVRVTETKYPEPKAQAPVKAEDPDSA